MTSRMPLLAVSLFFACRLAAAPRRDAARLRGDCAKGGRPANPFHRLSVDDPPTGVDRSATDEAQLDGHRHADLFRRRAVQGDVSSKVYNCLDLAEQRESTDSFVKDNVTFRIIARRNSLGRPAAW